MVKWNGRTILTMEPDLTIESDASNQASYQDTSTGSSWTTQEKTWHINCLELLTATLALKTFVRKQGCVSTAQDRQHNSSCLYQQSRRNSIQRTGLPSLRPMDVVSGEEHSHPSAAHTRNTEPHGGQGVENHGRSIRLEIGSTNMREHQQTLRSTGSGPVCVRTDQSVPPLFQLWPDLQRMHSGLDDMEGICKPPMEPDTACSKENTDRCDAPVWKSQPWYALLLSILVDWPCLLPEQSFKEVSLVPQLAVWGISARHSAVRAFQARLLNLSSNLGGQRQINLTIHSLGDGIAGVVNGVQIHFQDL